jgi:hypothetical protein
MKRFIGRRINIAHTLQLRYGIGTNIAVLEFIAYFIQAAFTTGRKSSPLSAVWYNFLNSLVQRLLDGIAIPEYELDRAIDILRPLDKAGRARNLVAYIAFADAILLTWKAHPTAYPSGPTRQLLTLQEKASSRLIPYQGPIQFMAAAILAEDTFYDQNGPYCSIIGVNDESNHLRANRMLNGNLLEYAQLAPFNKKVTATFYTHNDDIVTLAKQYLRLRLAICRFIVMGQINVAGIWQYEVVQCLTNAPANESQLRFAVKTLQAARYKYLSKRGYREILNLK